MTTSGSSGQDETLLYQRAKRLASLLLPDIEKRLKNALITLGDPYLVRARIEPSRIKELHSLKRKASQKEWDLEEALTKATDFIGFRITCNNLQDVHRVVDLLEQSLANDGIEAKKLDYTKNPKRDGYRAIHLVFHTVVKIDRNEGSIGCEVQVRSLLQNAWAILSREDIYAGGTEPPKGVLQKMKSLSILLARADKAADEVRRELSRPRRGRKPAKGQPLNAASIAFIYKRAFGKRPPEYLVQSTVRDFAGTPIRADGLEQALLDNKFIGRLCKAYQEHVQWKVDTDNIFRWVVHSIIHGTKSAIREAKRDGLQAWQEIEAVARREQMADLPKTCEEFFEGVEWHDKHSDPASDIHRWAIALGTSENCESCGTEIVNAYGFAEALIEHWGLKDEKADEIQSAIESAVENSGAQCGSFMCSYCEYRLHKDD